MNEENKKNLNDVLFKLHNLEEDLKKISDKYSGNELEIRLKRILFTNIIKSLNLSEDLIESLINLEYFIDESEKNN